MYQTVCCILYATFNTNSQLHRLMELFLFTSQFYMFRQNFDRKIKVGCDFLMVKIPANTFVGLNLIRLKAYNFSSNHSVEQYIMAARYITSGRAPSSAPRDYWPSLLPGLIDGLISVLSVSTVIIAPEWPG